MAAKKIGAIITLDGEKEFKQNVTSCNKSLTELKSEMGLVKAQSEGQANSLESLSKKHEILTKVLEEQKAKEEAVRKGLDHARESYEKVGAGIDKLNKEQESHQNRLIELKAAYDSAEKELTEMTKSGNESEQSMRQQETVVQSLSNEIKEEESALNELSTAIAKGEKNYQSAGNRVKDWETKLNTAEAQVIHANSAVNKNAAYMREAEQSSDHCATSIDEFGKAVKGAEEVTVDFGTVIKTNLANTLVNVSKGAVSDVTSSIGSLESAQKQFQASTGASTTEMKRYNSVMEELHSNNYGDDINDVAQAMALVKQYTNEVDPSNLKEMAENGIAMRDVFNMDLSETIRGVDSLIDNMGVTSEEAFDLMAKGAQNGLNKSGELGDNIAEYGQLWGQAGFSAQEMFMIMDNGLDSGAYNLDKVNDFVKEFGNSLADGRIEQNIEFFSSGTKNLFYQWKAGKATTKDVFQSVIRDLSNAQNKQEALTLASNTWSALGEDNAMKVITSLNQVNHTFDDVKGTMEKVKEVKYDTLEARFKQLGKKFQTEVGVPIAEEALPAIEDGLDMVIDNLDTLIPLFGSVAAGALAFKTASEAVKIYETTMEAVTVAKVAYTSATEGATVAQKILNVVTAANPFVLIATAVATAGTALLLYTKFAGEASDGVKELTESNQRVCESANEVSESAENLMESYADTTAEMEAQGEYARTLAKRIEDLAEKTSLSNEETSVMQGYIAELNELVPNLNLAYDEQAGKLSMTNDQLESYLENSQKEIELNAAKEYAIELLKKRSELEIEAIKLAQEKEQLDADNTTLQLGRISALFSGNMDLYQSLTGVSEAQKENSEAIEENGGQQTNLRSELEATQAWLEQHGIDLELLTESTDKNTDSTKNNALAQADAANSNSAAMQQIVDTYTGMQQKVSEVLDSQMNMFEEFNAGTEISSEKLLSNMQSQLDGVTNWADNMALLADRGVNQGILDKLSEMGPQGSTYVQAFASMTDEQLKQANEMWSQSLDMKSGVNASVQGMIEEYTAALNGGKEQMTEAMNMVGIDISAGLGNGITAGIEQGTIAVDEMGNAVINQAKATFDEHSPSKVFADIGKNVVAGLASGLIGSQSQAVSAIQAMAQQMAALAKSALSSQNFSQVGRQISTGIQTGITSGKPEVISCINTLGTEARTTAQNKMNANNFKPAGKQVATGLATGIEAGEGDVREAVKALASTAQDTGLNRWTLYNDGYNVSAGLASGIYAGESYVINAVADVCYEAVRKAKSYLRIQSPSKVFQEIGEYTAEGFGIGYENKMEDVNKVIRSSMEIPQARGRGASYGGADSGIRNLLQKYLPYLADRGQNIYLYPNRRSFEREILEISNKGMSVMAAREGMK